MAGRGHEFEARHPLHFGCVLALRGRATWCSGPGCAWPWPGHVQRDTTSDGTLAFGHSRSGNTHALVAQQAEQPPCKRQAARHQNKEPSSSSRFEGGNRPQRLGGAGTRDRMAFHWGCSSDPGRAAALQAAGRRFEPCHLHQCFVNSAVRVPACLVGSRGFESRTRRQISLPR